MPLSPAARALVTIAYGRKIIREGPPAQDYLLTLLLSTKAGQRAEMLTWVQAYRAEQQAAVAVIDSQQAATKAAEQARLGDLQALETAIPTDG